MGLSVVGGNTDAPTVQHSQSISTEIGSIYIVRSAPVAVDLSAMGTPMIVSVQLSTDENVLELDMDSLSEIIAVLTRVRDGLSRETWVQH